VPVIRASDKLLEIGWEQAEPAARRVHALSASSGFPRPSIYQQHSTFNREASNTAHDNPLQWRIVEESTTPPQKAFVWKRLQP